jgi:DNA-binding transcriptional ArsR family regulator
VTQDDNNTAAMASIEEAAEYAARADAQVRAVLGRVLAQKRSAGVALDYVMALAPGTKANCWAIAEAAGHGAAVDVGAQAGDGGHGPAPSTGDRPLRANAGHRGVRHGLAPGTVSEHLTVLRDTGLVTGQRQRHEIRYRRTAMGTAPVRGW